MPNHEPMILASDLQPGDRFRWTEDGTPDICYRASKLFRPNGDPSDKCYLSVGHSAADCIVVYPDAGRQVFLVQD